MERKRIVIIGAGNVATHLARALDDKASVVQVLSRNIDHARCLCEQLRAATPITDISHINRNADFYLIAVNDDSIALIAEAFPDVTGIVAHTSGSVGIEALDGIGAHRGVFYPLQTFSISKPVVVSEVPFFIEGSDYIAFTELSSLASSISNHVYAADSHQRAVLHIAAVFGCNFFNHMLSISSDLLKAEGYGLEVLKPLLYETLAKALDRGPRESQTGPAVRGDFGVIEKHLSKLQGDDKAIYKLITDAIYHAHNK